ncbi:uncharacterized protein LOC105841986 isoform X2 [Bombyx mori]|uniref:Peptidase S1 domain-containing protein n=1 Tax=Bombyx mori TaxID=7091 RepID=A0A8R2GAK3_BOMMO|nr:uncharacterized protein LOC105841986 isoform X2 [Bombyx mori]
MLVKIVIVFFITKFARGQVNGEFWWMNDKIAKYHNTLIPPPVYEDLPEYETDDSVKIVFRDSEFEKHNSIFHGRHGHGKLKNHNLPKRDYVQYPNENIAHSKYDQSENANNLMMASESGKLNKKLIADKQATVFKPDNNIVFELPKKTKQVLKNYPDVELKTTEQAMPLTRSTFETHPPFASFNDYMNFINVDQKPETTPSDICTYIRQMECERRMGLVYNLEVGRDPKKIPNDPQLICCILFPKTDRVQSTSETIALAQEHNTNPPKTSTKTPNELNKVVLNLTKIDDYISKYAVVRNNSSGVQGTNIEKNVIIPTKQTLNLNKPSQSMCTYITEQQCLMNHGFVYNFSPKGYPTTVPSNPHLICCILLRMTDTAQTTATVFAQESITVPPKPSTEATNVLRKPVPNLSNIDNYISKYGVIKNSSDLQLNNGNTQNEIVSDIKVTKNKSADITCTYTTERDCLINNGIIYKEKPKRSQENSRSVCCILPLEKSLQIAIKTPSLEEKYVSQTIQPSLNSKNKFQYIEDFIAKFGVNTNDSKTQHENKQHQPNTQTESSTSISTTISYIDIFQTKKTINEESHFNSKPNFVDKIDPNKSVHASNTKTVETNNYTESVNRIVGTNNIYNEEKQESTGICKYIMKQECMNRKGFIYSTDFGKSIKRGPNDPQLVCCILDDNLANSHDTGDEIPSYSSTRTYNSQETTTSSTSPTINKNGIQEVRTTAIPFIFPDKKNYIFSYNNQLNINKPPVKNENYTLNDNKNTQTGSLLKPNIDYLISKYGVNESKSENIAMNKVNENKNENNAIVEKNISSAILYKKIKNCTFINKYKCLNVNGTISNLPSEIINKIANNQNLVCCVMPSNTKHSTEKSIKESIEIKNNFSKETETNANLVFFPKNNLLKKPTEKTLVFFDKVNEKTNKNEGDKSSNICTYIKEFECKQRYGFVYGIEFGKSTKKGPSDPELVCCILPESNKNNYQVNVVAHTNIGVFNEQTENLQTTGPNNDISPQIDPKRNVFIHKPKEASSFVFPTEKYEYKNNKLSNVEHNMEYTNKIENHPLKNTATSKHDNNYKETEKLVMTSNINPINNRYKRSTDENSNTALNQRMVLLQRRFTTQPPKLSKEITRVKIVTSDYDEDPYWNVKNTKFHSPKATNKKECDYQTCDYYIDELPKPGLSGLYSDHGQKPSYYVDYNDDDIISSDSDYEDIGASFGYSTVDPKIGTTKSKTYLQVGPSRRNTIAPETYDPINEQKNTDDSKSEDSSDTEPIINSDSTEDAVDDQLFEDCGRTIVRTNFDATKRSGDAKYGSHPWLALVVPTKQQQKILCYATLIHPKAAITTADCVYEKPPGGVTLIAGVWDLNQRSRAKTRVPAIHIHKEYTNEHLDRDLAILTWRLPLKLGPNIQPACLGDVNLGADCMIFGWSGFDQAIKSRSKWQRVTTGDCDDIVTSSEQEIPRTAFCAKFHSRRTVSGIGGSLICNVDGRWSLVGVAVSRHISLVLLPARPWGLKAGNFIDGI